MYTHNDYYNYLNCFYKILIMTLYYTNVLNSIILIISDITTIYDRIQFIHHRINKKDK